MYIEDNKYIRKDTKMAVRYSDHKVYESDLVNFEPEILIASAKTWNGRRKRLMIKCTFTPEFNTFITLEFEGAENTYFNSIVDAMNAYNEL